MSLFLWVPCLDVLRHPGVAWRACRFRSGSAAGAASRALPQAALRRPLCTRRRLSRARRPLHTQPRPNPPPAPPCAAYFGLERSDISARVDAAFNSTGYSLVSDNEHIIYLNPQLQARLVWLLLSSVAWAVL